MKEIYINADDYNSDSIKTIQGNNNAEEYKIYLQYDNEKIDLTGKTVNLGFLRVGSTEGDIIENLNVTNPKEGEITLKITNKISKRNGTYSCQLAILGEGDFLEHTATFTLTVENNIFSDITKAIADSKDFTYLENILDKASKLSEKLKENTSSATNANSNLESNITEANNINSKLLENTSTATSLNKNLESNIDLAKEVKETIKDLDTKNIEATSKIERLEGLNTKVEELSDNINKGLPLNSELIKNVESAKTANNELIATNNDAKAKKTDLDNSLEEAKKYIAGLDGSKNPVQMQLDIDTLKNGLKSNQSLSYEGSSIAANNTLEGRTEGMMIGGRTLVNLVNIRKMILGDSSKEIAFENDIIKFKKAYPNEITYLKVPFLSKPNTTYTIVYDVIKNNVEQPDESKYIIYPDGVFGDFNSTMNTFPKNGQIGLNKICLNSKSTLFGTFSLGFHRVNVGAEIWIKNLMILEGDWTNKEIPSYFEGLKSFGEAEKVEDKYKITLLSNGKNLFNINNIELKIESIIKTDNGYILKNYSNNTNKKVKDLFPFLMVGKTYTFSFEFDYKGNSPTGISSTIAFYDFKSSSIITTIYSGNQITITNDMLENCVFLYGVTTGETMIKNIQIEESSNKTSYKEYQSNKKYILIKEPLHESNYLYEDNGQVKVYEKKKKYTFTGDENWSTNSNVENEKTLYFYTNVLDNSIDKININNIVCNTLPTLSNYDSTCVIDSIFNTNGSNNIRIRISKSKLKSQDLEGFKAWLKANKTTIVYQLAEPVVEIVENCVDIDLDTYQEKTYFSIENSLPGTLDFKVPSNIGSSLQNLAKEVNNIWDVINNLLVPSIVKANGNIAMIKLNNNLK
ncbi:MAG: BppU family phage baseplate upper protein [Clostridium perfringens]|nr:BppU family phage baseplate upper protein [Clostridium perfringens]